MKLKKIGERNLPTHRFDPGSYGDSPAELLRVTAHRTACDIHRTRNAEEQRTVIEDFYREYSLPGIRNSLWQLARFTAAGSFHLQEPEERDNLMVFYRRLEEVLEVVNEQRIQIN